MKQRCIEFTDTTNSKYVQRKYSKIHKSVWKLRQVILLSLYEETWKVFFNYKELMTTLFTINKIPMSGIESGPPGWKPGILATRPHGISINLIVFPVLPDTQTNIILANTCNTHKLEKETPWIPSLTLYIICMFDKEKVL